MTAVIDARFAGGAIEVYASEIIDQPVVQVVIPGCDLALFSHEARNLAQALIDAADDADAAESKILRRAPGVDDRLRELDR